MRTERYNDGYGERIALFYPYDPDTNALLKDVLGFPAFKWDKDQKCWSIQTDPKVVREAVELLGTRDYDFTKSVIRGGQGEEAGQRIQPMQRGR